MSLRGVLGAFAVLCSLGLSLIIPKVSSAGQLAELATATSIHGQLQSTQNYRGGMKAVKGARALSKNAGQQAGYANEVMDQRTSYQQNSTNVVRTKSKGSVDAAEAKAFDATHPVVGASYTTSGIVAYDGLISGHRVVFLIRLDGPNQYQILGFRLHDPNIPALPVKSVVNVTGVYAAKIKEPQTGSLVHGFDNAVFTAGAPEGAIAQEAKSEQKEEKPTFNSVLKGWEFRGTVEVKGQTTGVFVRDKDLKYAHSGVELDKDVKVISLSNGKAKVSVNGQRLEVAPW